MMLNNPLMTNQQGKLQTLTLALKLPQLELTNTGDNFSL
jgi:hypothetical protein